MQHILIRPPGLIIIVDGLGKTAHVHDTEVGVDIRPLVRRWLTPVVEACPGKTTHEPFSFRSYAPPVLGRAGPGWSDTIVIRHIGINSILIINATAGDGAGHLRAYDGLIRMFFTIRVQSPKIVVEASN